MQGYIVQIIIRVMFRIKSFFIQNICLEGDKGDILNCQLF